MRYLCGMYKSELKRRFKTWTAIGRLCHVSHEAVRQWPELIPLQWACTIEVMTGGELKVNLRLYD